MFKELFFYFFKYKIIIIKKYLKKTIILTVSLYVRSPVWFFVHTDRIAYCKVVVCLVSVVDILHLNKYITNT